MSNAMLIIGLMSTVTSVIRQIEAQQAIAGDKSIWTGEFKLALALSIVEDVYNTAQGGKPVVPFSVLKDTITNTINATVAIYNALSIFRRKS